MSDTKTKLSKEFCKEDFKKERNARRPLMLFVWISSSIGAAFCFLLSLLLYSYSFTVGLIISLCVASIPVFNIVQIIVDIITMRMVNQGKFSIIKDEVCEKVDGKWFYWYFGRLPSQNFGHRYSLDEKCQKMLDFTRHGIYVTTPSVYGYTNQYDTFYLMVLDGRKKPLIAYHSDMYDCENFE